MKKPSSQNESGHKKVCKAIQIYVLESPQTLPHNNRSCPFPEQAVVAGNLLRSTTKGNSADRSDKGHSRATTFHR